MSMPPSGMIGEMNEDAIIEAEIRQELELIDLDHDDVILDQVDNNIEDILPDVGREEEPQVDEILGYLHRIQKQTKDFERELEECDELLNHNAEMKNSHDVLEDLGILEETAKNQGEDPDELKRKILEAIDKEDDIFDDEDVSAEETIFLTSEVDLLPGQETGGERQVDGHEDGQLLPEDGVVALVDETENLEKCLHQQLKQLQLKYKQREEQWKKETEARRQEEKRKQKLENEKRQEIFERHQKQNEEIVQQRKIEEQKMESELAEKQKLMEVEVKKFEEEITLLTAGMKREQEEFDLFQKQQYEKSQHKRKIAVITIQSWYRGCRIRRQYNSVLKERQLERKKKKEENRIKEIEEEIQKKKEEEKRQEEKKKRQEEEARIIEEEKRKKEKEEQKKTEELKKLLEEEKKQKEEEERKKREEEKKKLEEQQLKEEEKRRKEEAERQKKEEERKKLEEQQLKEEEEKRKKEEAERKRKEEEAKKAEEKKLIESKRQEEEKRKKEVEAKKVEEKKIAEEKRKQEQEKRKEEKEKAENLKAKPEESTRGRFPSSQSLQQKQVTGQKSGESNSLVANSLSPHLEAQRLVWIKECLPWSKISNEPWKLKSGASKKPLRRPSSAKKLPPLTEDVIVAAARAATLRQVTTVELHDLPGCNMSILGQCWGLRGLTMTNCHLVTVEGLQQCRQLQYLSLRDNKIEYIDLKDLGNLQYTDLSHNNISVLHGFDGCTNLRWLDLSHNRLTRLGGLSPLRRIHTLHLSHNQLISAKGLGDIPTVQNLNLSDNHLPAVDDLDKLCLLQYLNISANNLVKFPGLANQVLLQECVLEDNSISTVSEVNSRWLPLLHKLDLGQNSIDELSSLDNLISLKILNVSQNQILDLDNIISAVNCCLSVEDLYIQGNPASDEDNYREKLQKSLPGLKLLDGGPLLHPDQASVILQPQSHFEAMCLMQAQLHQDVRQTFEQELGLVVREPALNQIQLCEIYFKFCDKSFKLAVDHRYAHEYGEISTNIPTAPQTPRSSRPRSSRTKLVQKEPESYLSPKEMFENALISRSNGTDSVKAVSSVTTDSTEPGKMPGSEAASGEIARTAELEPRVKSATKIQAVWRGYTVRKEISNHAELWMSAVIIQIAWRRYKMRHQQKNRRETELSPPGVHSGDLSLEDQAVLKELNTAATKIQALWRGYILRLKLFAALEFARLDEEEDEFGLDEFDINEFNFDEESLERGWRPSEIPQMPASHPVLGKPPIGRKPLPDVLRLDLQATPPPFQPPSKIKHAWRNMDSPLSDIKGRTPHPPPSVMSDLDTHRTGLSKKEEKLSEEWGFKDSRTAELMLQRAKKMKYNSDRRKKISKLDPKQRLALFRKLEETTKLHPIRPQLRKFPPRKEYFQAREQEIQRKELAKHQEVHARASRTYEWLHTQVGSLDTVDFRNNQSGLHHSSRYGSESNLPRMDHEVTGGRRFQQSPVSVDHFDSCSIDENSSKHYRRFSSGENLSLVGQGTVLPPIKTNSAGSNSRQREKMSWRTKPIDKDVGWGGGKKRHIYK